MFIICFHYTFRLFKRMHRITRKNVQIVYRIWWPFIPDTLYCTIAVSARDMYVQLCCTSDSGTRCIHLSRGKRLTMNISNFTGLPQRFLCGQEVQGGEDASSILLIVHNSLLGITVILGMDISSPFHSQLIQCKTMHISKHITWYIKAVIRGSLSPQHGATSVCGWRNGLQYGGQLRVY